MVPEIHLNHLAEPISYLNLVQVKAHPMYIRNNENDVISDIDNIIVLGINHRHADLTTEEPEETSSSRDVFWIF